MNSKPTVLSIAGSDSGGGAGLQADTKTIEANGCFATTVVTAVTAQNTQGVQGFETISSELLGKQLKSVLSDFDVAAIKTGMIPTRDSIELVAKRLASVSEIPLVVDPVMISTSGHSLIDAVAVETMKYTLMPIADVVTPNIDEARLLAGIEIENRSDMMDAAEIIIGLGCGHVLIKGGHLREEDAVDLLFNGEHFIEYSTPRIGGPDVHGTGCTFASAIAANLAKSLDMEDAIMEGKRYLTQAILARHNPGKGSLVLGF